MLETRSNSARPLYIKTLYCFLWSSICIVLISRYKNVLAQNSSIHLCNLSSWWRHQMEVFSALPVNSPHKGQWWGALMFSLIDLRPKKRLSEQPRQWWFETPSPSPQLVVITSETLPTVNPSFLTTANQHGSPIYSVQKSMAFCVMTEDDWFTIIYVDYSSLWDWLRQVGNKVSTWPYKRNHILQTQWANIIGVTYCSLLNPYISVKYDVLSWNLAFLMAKYFRVFLKWRDRHGSSQG